MYRSPSLVDAPTRVQRAPRRGNQRTVGSTDCDSCRRPSIIFRAAWVQMELLLVRLRDVTRIDDAAVAIENSSLLSMGSESLALSRARHLARRQFLIRRPCRSTPMGSPSEGDLSGLRSTISSREKLGVIAASTWRQQTWRPGSRCSERCLNIVAALKSGPSSRIKAKYRPPACVRSSTRTVGVH
jgi:hypothetical protein